MNMRRLFLKWGSAFAGLALATVIAGGGIFLWPSNRITPTFSAASQRRSGYLSTAQPKAVGPKINFSIPVDPASLKLTTPRAAQALNAALPFSTAPNPPAAPFVLKTKGEDRDRALQCLTQAVYYEAGFEPAAGQEAVAQVVLNRLRHPIFPKTICGVVYQGAGLKTGCQFSFTCDGSLSRAPQKAAWTRSRLVAEQAVDGFVLTSVGHATHYHTQWVVPWWRPTVNKVTQIGAHIFYRWPGSLGLPPAFNGQYLGFEPVITTQTAISAPSSGAPPTLVAKADGGSGAPIPPPGMPMESPRQRLLALSAHGMLGQRPDFNAALPSDAASRTTPPSSSSRPATPL